MKHATPAALGSISEVLESLRKFAELRERKLGVFYLGPAAFLHFHEDPAGMFADVRTREGWKRLPVNSKREATEFLRVVGAALEIRCGAVRVTRHSDPA